jgi:hypothetical protein
MPSMQINSYLDYIGAQFRINELRSFLFCTANRKGVNPNDLELSRTELRILTERSDEYLENILKGERIATQLEGEETNG